MIHLISCVIVFSLLCTFYGLVNNAKFLGILDAIFSDSLMFFHHSSTNRIYFVNYLHRQHYCLETVSMTACVKMKTTFQYSQRSYSLSKI